MPGLCHWAAGDQRGATPNRPAHPFSLLPSQDADGPPPLPKAPALEARQVIYCASSRGWLKKEQGTSCQYLCDLKHG